MPRRKPISTDQTLNNDAVLALPPPRVVTTHKHETHKDPYEVPPGAVPAKVSNVHTTAQKPKKNLSARDAASRELAKADMRARAARYNTYLDKMAETGGNQIVALANAYAISPDQARERLYELQADVRSGIGGTDVGEVLARNDLDLAARANILRKHAYSDNRAASLKAIDMANELEGGSGEFGSFESFLRTYKQQKG